MIRAVLLTVLLLAVLVAPGAGTGARAGGTWLAFVAAEDDDQLVVAELTVGGGSVIRRIAVPRGPLNVAGVQPTVPQPRTAVLVTSPVAGRVTLVDPRSLRVVKVLGGFGYPYDVELAPSGLYAYATDERRGQLAVISLTRRRVVKRVDVGRRAHELAVSSSGGTIWVTHGPRKHEVTVLDASNPSRPRVVRRIRTVGAPHDIAAQPGRFWVTYWGSGAIAAFDDISGRRLFRRHLGERIDHLAVTSTQVWVTNQANGRLLILSAKTGGVLRRYPVGPRPRHVSAFTDRGVVAVHDSGRLVVVFPTGQGSRYSLPVGHGLEGVVQLVV